MEGLWRATSAKPAGMIINASELSRLILRNPAKQEKLENADINLDHLLTAVRFSLKHKENEINLVYTEAKCGLTLLVIPIKQ